MTGAADGDVGAVHAANASFYDALERGDLDAMSDVWEHSDRVTVTHPGWPTIRGWAKVAASSCSAASIMSVIQPQIVAMPVGCRSSGTMLRNAAT